MACRLVYFGKTIGTLVEEAEEVYGSQRNTMIVATWLAGDVLMALLVRARMHKSSRPRTVTLTSTYLVISSCMYICLHVHMYLAHILPSLPCLVHDHESSFSPRDAPRMS